MLRYDRINLNCAWIFTLFSIGIKLRNESLCVQIIACLECMFALYGK